MPSTLPSDVAGLLRSMVSLLPAARPTLRKVYSQLLQLHATYMAADHSAQYLQTVWGVPSCAVPASLFQKNPSEVATTTRATDVQHSVARTAPSAHATRIQTLHVPIIPVADTTESAGTYTSNLPRGATAESGLPETPPHPVPLLDTAKTSSASAPTSTLTAEKAATVPAAASHVTVVRHNSVPQVLPL